jgi:leucyl/phenylalanyl-tRNA--protein transferase
MRGFGADELLDCYARGVFPMAEARDDPRIFLLDPDERGILPLDKFHIPRSLKKTVRQDVYKITIDTRFNDVVDACAQPGPGREETWINYGIKGLYAELHEAGHAHSLECWLGDTLAGGLYGVSLGAAFFGESMFSVQRDASKVALVHLVARLKFGDYQLLDSQFTTEHLNQFGGCAISRDDYKALLNQALTAGGNFYAMPGDTSGAQVLQSSTQTS